MLPKRKFYCLTLLYFLLINNPSILAQKFASSVKKFISVNQPYDFFHCINNAAGEDLNWFWKEWSFTKWKFDQAVTGVTYVDNDPAKGALITIENKGRLYCRLS